MINHARTLLINQSASRTSPSDVGYEYVPPAYTEITLPTTLATIHNIIFGRTPDNYFRNYRARELMSYLHQTELADYVYKLDPRVTYWPGINDNKLYSPAKKVFLKQVSGAVNRLAIGGTINPSNATGRSEYEYTVIFGYSDPGAKPTFVVQPFPKTKKPTVTVFENTARLGSVPLVESDLAIRVQSASLPITGSRLLTEASDIIVIEDYTDATGGEIWLEQAENILPFLAPPFAATPLPLLEALSSANLTTVVGIWSVAGRVNPTPALTSVLPNLEFLGEPTYLELFGVEDKEPYRTFKTLWEEHPLPAYKLSGIVLALIYRTNELLRIQS